MTSEMFKLAIERWGFPALVCLCCGYVLRNDVLLPLVEQHATFLKTIAESQKDISQAVTEQTKLLYEIQESRREP